MGSNTCVAQNMLFLFLVSFAISNVFFAASLVNVKIMLFFGSLSMSEILMVLKLVLNTLVEILQGLQL
ncbi:hypothetical protein D9M73_203720 [compost metagenome]